jgi:hypothetical protein
MLFRALPFWQLGDRLLTFFPPPVQAKLDGETAQGVQFALRLWRGSCEGTMIVEMQRCAGCGFLYCQAAKTILRAAKGLPPSKKAAVRRMPCVEESKEQIEATLCEGLETCTNLLTKESRRDAHLLALESLAGLSQASENREFCAQSILRSAGVVSVLVSLIESYRAHGHPTNDIERQHLAMMYRYSLIVLGNCLETLSCEDKVLADLLREYPQLSEAPMLAGLMQQVSQARQQPYEACAALKCLQGLVSVSPKAKHQVLMIGGGSETVHLAQQEGRTSCKMLEQESSKLYALLMQP